MSEKSISWPQAKTHGAEFRLGDITIKHAPTNVDKEQDPTLKVMLAMLMDQADGGGPRIEDEESGLNEAAANPIIDGNNKLPSQPTSDPQVMARLAQLDSAVESLRQWVGSLQSNFVENTKRIKALEYEIGKLSTPPDQENRDTINDE